MLLLGLMFLEPAYGWELRAWLTSGVAGGGTAQADVPALAAENEVLKAELAELQGVAAQMPATATDGIRAMVYSRYPFNFKNELLVNAGSDQGVAQGKAVLFQGVVIGSVAEVFPDSSLVETVFDNEFKMPVRIGSGGYDALLTGGAYPQATSIEKTAQVAAGDVVYTATPGMPYGLPVALVASTGTSPDDLFMAASLSFAYDVNTIQAVLIVK